MSLPQGSVNSTLLSDGLYRKEIAPVIVDDEKRIVASDIYTRQQQPYFAAEGVVSFLCLAVVAAGLLITTTVLMLTTPKAKIRVAFIGNSITFVNDLPRLMEAMSANFIEQNSCLHGATNFASLLEKGNGMGNKWNSSNGQVSLDSKTRSFIQTNSSTSYATTTTLYDFGTCSVPQLLLGHDENLVASNANEYYSVSFKNPCWKYPEYYYYLESILTVPQHWDYVVMNDHTQYPAVERTRDKSLEVLETVYGPYILKARGRPVFMVTHGYIKNETYADDVNDDDDGEYDELDEMLHNVPEMTSLLYDGYVSYANLLADQLPKSQRPLLAPVGFAFLLVWEENYELWEKLFYVDGFHPSPHGTFLIGCVLYATLRRSLFQVMPDDVSDWFSRARKMEVDFDGPSMPFPTHKEALYLLETAQRVVLMGELPESLEIESDIYENRYA